MGIDFFELITRFAVIMFYDYRKGNGTFRIVWKSMARWRRIGWDGMLEWLDKEMWKIPNRHTTLHVDSSTYQRWIKTKESKSFQQIAYGRDIKFSIVLAADNTNSLNDILASLRAQSYLNWELYIVSDCAEMEQSEANIFYIQCGETTAKNSRWKLGIGEVKGDWIIFADPYMVFSPYALEEMVHFITQNSELSLLYCDEDEIDNGRRCNPYFKGGFNPDLLYSMPYIGMALVSKTSVVRSIEGVFESIDVCGEYDLILRLWETLGEKSIGKLSKILFHFKRNGQQYGIFDALKEHFDRIHQKVHIENGLCPDTFRIRWEIEKPMPKVSIIIPTRDQVDILRICVESILEKTTYPNYEIYIVNNQSTCPETIDYLEKIAQNLRISVLEFDQPFNYSAINNFAVSQANGDVIALVNNDVEVISPHWLDEMVSHALRKDIGCVGAMLYYPDNTIQHAGVITGIGDVAGHIHKNMIRGSSGYYKRACVVQNFSAVTAACLVLKKSVYNEVEGLDETHLSVAYNDVDLCLKVQHVGYRNLWTPYAELYHHESKSRGKDNTIEKKRRYNAEVAYMIRKWGDVLQRDRYYHPYLSQTAEQFQLRRRG